MIKSIKPNPSYANARDAKLDIKRVGKANYDYYVEINNLIRNGGDYESMRVKAPRHCHHVWLGS